MGHTPWTADISSVLTRAGWALSPRAAWRTAMSPASQGDGRVPTRRGQLPCPHAAGSTSASPVVAIVLSQFPRYDEAFLLRELVALERQGVHFTIYSLKPCRDQVVHDDAARLARRTVYAPLSSGAVWLAVARQAWRQPAAVASVIGQLCRHFWRHPVVLAKSLIVCMKAVYFGEVARATGVRAVHGGWATYPATAAWVMQRLYELPYSFTGHAHDIYLDTTMLAEKIRSARWVTTCTEQNAEYLSQFANGHAERIVVNHHGLDLSRFSVEKGDMARGQAPWGHEPGTRDQGVVPIQHGLLSRPQQAQPTITSLSSKNDSCVPIVLSVGSLLSCKGFEDLIEACRLLRGRGVRFRCVIAGGGPLEQELRRRIAAASLNDVVTLLGYISQQELLPWYRRASAFALSAVKEIHWGIPNVLIESLAVGVPVICTELPAIRELLGRAPGDTTGGGGRGDEEPGREPGTRNGVVPTRAGQLVRPQPAQSTGTSPTIPADRHVPGYEVAECGLIVPERDPSALAAAIERLLMDRELAQRLGAAGQAAVRRGWDIAVTGRQFKELLLGK